MLSGRSHLLLAVPDYEKEHVSLSFFFPLPLPSGLTGKGEGGGGPLLRNTIRTIGATQVSGREGKFFGPWALAKVTDSQI